MQSANSDYDCSTTYILRNFKSREKEQIYMFYWLIYSTYLAQFGI